MNKATPFLMFNDQLEVALELYASIFPGTKVTQRARAGKGGPLQSARFEVCGQRFMGFNGGPHFKFSEAFSIFVSCEDQEEVDTYWNKLVKAGAKPTMCGWINDPFGLSWQIVPKRFTELIGDGNPEKVKAVVDAMMKMQKLDVAVLEKAWRDAGPV